MFLQFKVPKSDRQALRFSWWNDGDITAAPDEYDLSVHPFGATSSTFCANFTLSPSVAKRTVTKLGRRS